MISRGLVTVWQAGEEKEEQHNTVRRPREDAIINEIANKCEGDTCEISATNTNDNRRRRRWKERHRSCTKMQSYFMAGRGGRKGIQASRRRMQFVASFIWANTHSTQIQCKRTSERPSDTFPGTRAITNIFPVSSSTAGVSARQ